MPSIYVKDHLVTMLLPDTHRDRHTHSRMIALPKLLKLSVVIKEMYASITKHCILVPAIGRWRHTAGKVGLTVGWAPHWPCICICSVCIPPYTAFLQEYGAFYLFRLKASSIFIGLRKLLHYLHYVGVSQLQLLACYNFDIH